MKELVIYNYPNKDVYKPDRNSLKKKIAIVLHKSESSISQGKDWAVIKIWRSQLNREPNHKSKEVSHSLLAIFKLSSLQPRAVMSNNRIPTTAS